MEQGLQIWNSDGKSLLDTSLQTSSILGTVGVSAIGVQTISDARFAWGTPFFLSDSMYAGTELKGTFSGTTLTLTASSDTGGLATFKPLTVYYGVF